MSYNLFMAQRGRNGGGAGGVKRGHMLAPNEHSACPRRVARFHIVLKRRRTRQRCVAPCLLSDLSQRQSHGLGWVTMLAWARVARGACGVKQHGWRTCQAAWRDEGGVPA